ncbi:MAG: hypothetical protein R2762_15385 [Bryobacteraceae bacterium]
MKTIEIPDQQHAALEAKAAALGLSLEAWLKQLADVRPPRRRQYSLDQLLAACDPSAPASSEDQDWTAAAAAGREAI